MAELGLERRQSVPWTPKLYHLSGTQPFLGPRRMQHVLLLFPKNWPRMSSLQFMRRACHLCCPVSSPLHITITIAIGYLQGAAVLKTQGRNGRPQGPPGASARPAGRAWVSSPQAWGREDSVLQLKDWIHKSTLDIHLQLDTHYSFLQASCLHTGAASWEPGCCLGWPWPHWDVAERNAFGFDWNTPHPLAFSSLQSPGLKRGRKGLNVSKSFWDMGFLKGERVMVSG